MQTNHKNPSKGSETYQVLIIDFSIQCCSSLAVFILVLFYTTSYIIVRGFFILL